MTITKKKTEVIPCIYERSFAYIYDQDEKYLAKFLSYILKVDYTSLLGNIKKISNNAPLKRKNDKKRQMDFVYRIDNLKIDVELNLRSKVSMDRNIGYITSLHSSHIQKGEYDYSKYKTYQININNEPITSSKRIVDEYLFRNIDGEVLSDKIKIYIISIPNMKKICYNKDRKVLEGLKYLIPFMMEDTDKYKTIFKGDKEMEEVFDRMETFSSDNEEWVTFRRENEYEEEYQMGMNMAREEGISQGIKQGISQGIEQGTIQNKIEIAKNMLKENMDISLISKLTALTKEEILQIKKKQE